MDAITLLKTRRSCRHFLTKQIKDEELQTIIECGLNAPSGMNKQDTKIVVIQDKNLIHQLSLLNAQVWGKDIDPFYNAPTLTIVFAPKDSKNNVKDGSLVIGAMQNAAYALHIGSCWINRALEMFDLEEGKKYLKKWHLEDYQGIGCCILGYPALEENQKTIKEDRVIYRND